MSSDGGGCLPVFDRDGRVVEMDVGGDGAVHRLLADTGSLPEGKLDAVRKECVRTGKPFEWAFLMDALQSERDQNITIDTAQIWFKTAKRPYVIIDAPGHREFLRNMITGASQADGAVVARLSASDPLLANQLALAGTTAELCQLLAKRSWFNNGGYFGFRSGAALGETLEAVPNRPVEALRATGAGTLQTFLFGRLPQALSGFTSLTLYQTKQEALEAAGLKE